MSTVGITRKLYVHKFIIVILLATVVMQLPAVWHLHGYILTGQDYNPVHFGQLYIEGDMPPNDDSGVGENARTLSLSNMYMWLPLLLYRTTELPLESMAFVQALLGLPLLLLSIYCLSLSLFRNSEAAAFTAILFPIGNFALFMTNIGYPLLFLKSYYYGDFNHAFVAIALAFLVWGRIELSAIATALLLLMNPTYGINLVEIGAMYLLISGRWKQLDYRMLLCVSITLAALAAAYFQVRLSAPIYAPAPVDARRFAIETYGHIDAHIFDLKSFLAAQLTLTSAMILAVAREWRVIKSGGISQYNGWSVTTSTLVIYIIIGVVGYYLLYVVSPELFIVLAPSKLAIITSLVVGCYVGYGLYTVLTRSGWIALLVAVLVFLVCFREEATRQYAGYWLGAVAFSGSLLLFAWRDGFAPPASNIRRAFIAIAIALLLADLCRNTAWIADPRFFVVPDMLYDIERKISKAAPKDAMMLPYRMPGSKNRYGIFGSLAARTYSRRGMVEWVVGRNAYFNSAERHRSEERFFQAATHAQLWLPMLEQAEKMRKERPLFYYFGINTSGNGPLLGSAGAWRIYTEAIDKEVNSINAMDLAKFARFAQQVGATYVLVCKDEKQKIPISALVQNSFFALIDVHLLVR